CALPFFAVDVPPHHHDGAVGAGGEGEALGADDEGHQPAEPPPAEDQQVGALARVDQDRHGVAVDHFGGDLDLGGPLPRELGGLGQQGVGRTAEAGARHPGDRVDVDVELGPHEGVDEMEGAADGGGMACGPADRLTGLVRVEDADRDLRSCCVRRVTTILCRGRPPTGPRTGPRNAEGAGTSGAGSCSYPVPDLNRCYRRERATSWAARRTGRVRDPWISPRTPYRI